jgi:Skp family chaperone for outer membrane proteins
MKSKPSWLLISVLVPGVLFTATALAQTPTPKPGQATPSTAATTSAELPKPKIAIINTGAFPDNIAELKVHYDKLRTEFAARESELASMKSAIDVKQEQIDKNGAKLTVQQIRRLQEEIEQLRKEGQRKLEDYQADIQKREEALTGPTYGKVNEFLNKYVAAKGITFVFSTQQIIETNLVVYIDPKADITKDFIDSYNKANPVTQAATAPAPNATKPTKP